MSLLLATLFLVDLPLGPGSESLARELVAPHQHAKAIDEGPWFLWDIRVQAHALVYKIAKPHQAPVLSIRVDLKEASKHGSQALTLESREGAPESAREAGEKVARTLRRALDSGRLSFRERAPPPKDSPVDMKGSDEEFLLTEGKANLASAKDSSPPPGTPRWLAALLLLALASTITAYRRVINACHLKVGGQGWLSTALLAGVTGLLLALMNDVVLHPNAHGWDTVRSVSGFTETPFPLWDKYGQLVIESGRLLGFFAEPGRETFTASRVSAVLSIFAMYGLALSLLRSHIAAILALGLYVTSPAFLFVARGEALSATGVLFMLTSAWLMTLAARERHLGLLICASLALTCLASFRLMGPVMAPVVGLLALLGPERDERREDTKAWFVKVALAWSIALALSLPHLWQMLWLMSRELGARPETDVIPRTLLDSTMWTPFAFVALAGIGLLGCARKERAIGAILVLWLGAALLAPASSAAYYQDQARYQIYALPALALAAGALVHFPLKVPRHLLVALSLLWLTLFAWQQHLCGDVLAHEQAEETQLLAWRELPKVLPQGAWLALPISTQGRARSALPDVELAQARPDIRLVSLDEARQSGDAPLFYFEGLSCSASYPSDPENAATDCLRARKNARLQPIRVVNVYPELPRKLAQRVRSRSESLSPFGGDPLQWNPRPFKQAPVPIGLYRLK